MTFSVRSRTSTVFRAALVLAVCAGVVTHATAEVSSWRTRTPQEPAGGPLTAPGGTGQATPRATEPVQGKRMRNRAPGPLPGLGTPLGPSSTNPTGDNAAYIAFEQGLYLTALRLAERDAKAGDAAAHTLIGRLYAEGLGVTPDATAAAKWYARAHELGDVAGTFALGMARATGTGVAKNVERAAELFETAAKTGHAFANYNLALAYLTGRGKPENLRRGAQHLEYAARQNIPRAQYDMATLYLTGEGVAHDAFKGAFWMSKAASSGLLEAQYEYAVLLLQGRGLNEDKPRIAEYLKSAAGKGVPGAQNRLAYLYRDGELLAEDAIEAARWRLIAARNGVKDPVLDQYVASLPAETRATARASADRFLNRAALGDVAVSPSPPSRAQ
jgi:TPR repeat protein